MTLRESPLKIAGLFFVITFVCIAAIVWKNFNNWGENQLANFNEDSCRQAIAKIYEKEKNGAKLPSTNENLEILGAWPDNVSLDGKVCLAVAGMAKNTSSAPVQTSLFLNGVRGPHLTKLALNRPETQYLLFSLDAPDDAKSAGAQFWRKLLAGSSRNAEGRKNITIGIARGNVDVPEATLTDKTISLKVYQPGAIKLGATALISLLICCFILARYTTMLRDHAEVAREESCGLKIAQLTKQRNDAQSILTANDATPEQKAEAMTQIANIANLLKFWDATKLKCKDGEYPLGPYSLAKTQMAVWFIVTVASFVFIWLTVGQSTGVVTDGVFILLGISALTGLAAVQIDTAGQESQAIRDNPITKGFWQDILQDGKGAKLQRLQITVWTAILVVIFGWSVVSTFTFPTFDTSLLVLAGIVNGTYLGFKPFEKEKK